MSTAGSVTISYTTLAEVALVAALVGGIAYIGSSKSANQPHPTSSSLAPQPPSAGAKKSNKKKKGSKTAVAPVVEPVVEAATAVKDHVVAGASAAVQRAPPAVQEAVAQVKQVATQVQEVASTAKKSGGKKANKKGSPKPDATKPDATKHAEQKVVHEQSDRADMVDPKDHPQVARVMKVVGGKVGAAPPPSAPSAAQDGEWESLEDDEGGWESVVSKKPSRPSTPSLNANGSSAAASRVVPGLPTAQMTKKQRENAAKKAKEQSAKDAANHEQEERLRQYRREQERAQLAAANAARARARPKSQNFFGSEPTAPAAKVLSGGMSASLDPTTGSLVWE